MDSSQPIAPLNKLPSRPLANTGVQAPLRLVICRADDVEEEVGDGGFVSPISVRAWERYIHMIFKPLDQESPPKPSVKNIAHRLQLVEIQVALLLCDLETRNTSGSSTLHETVMRFSVHQYCVTAHSILEGLGSHLYRIQARRQSGDHISPDAKITTSRWRKALATESSLRSDAANGTACEIEKRLKAITRIRDKIHLDRVDSDDEIHFNQIDRGCFVSTHDTFRDVLTILNGLWPGNCCLNEDIGWNGVWCSAGSVHLDERGGHLR